jgi:hyperosmotically inducible protein
LALLLLGCNATERKDLGESASELRKTVSRSADNAQLAARIKLALSQTKNLDAARIKVESSGGNVELLGTVPKAEQIKAAIAVAESIKGVRAVKSSLRVEASKMNSE